MLSPLLLAATVALPSLATDPAAAPAGMSTLTLITLHKGPQWQAGSSPEAEERQAAHLAHLEAMWKEGHAEVCGPVEPAGGDDSLRGICLYSADITEAQALAEADPAVASGHLRVEARTWWYGTDYLGFPMRWAGPHEGQGHKGKDHKGQGHGGQGHKGQGHKGQGHGGDHATVTHRFDDAEKWATVFDNPERDAWQKPVELVAALQIGKKSTVADIGAGTGYFNPHLAAAVGKKGRVIAIDVERSLVDHMTARAAQEGTPQVTPRLGRFEDPGLLDGEADLVLMVDTYHHISDRRAYFAQLARGLKPGGRLVIVDFKPGDIPVGPPEHHRISPEQVQAELTDAGWALSETLDVLPYQFVQVYTRAAD